MKQDIYFGNNSIKGLGELLERMNPKSIFLVTGKNSFALSGAQSIIMETLFQYKFCHFNKFNVNPQFSDVEKGLELFKNNPGIDLVIAVGGGSVLDVAKSVNISAVNRGPPIDLANNNNIQHKGVPLIAIPTTAGSGSESTRFATIYFKKVKFSFVHEFILPNIAIVDPFLTNSVPPKITAINGMDALAHAIASFWGVRSTEQSKKYAMEAIGLIRDNLEMAVNSPSNESRYAMSKAAHLAGQAINITRTTASHAISYAMTSYYGIQHGHAVSLTLGQLIKYNSMVTDEDNNDARGPEYVRSTVMELCSLLGARDPQEACEYVKKLMSRIGLSINLKDLGVRNESDIAVIVQSADVERMSNNPRRVTQEAVKKILLNIY